LVTASILTEEDSEKLEFQVKWNRKGAEEDTEKTNQ
jgi:hypothetical protein